MFVSFQHMPYLIDSVYLIHTALLQVSSNIMARVKQEKDYLFAIACIVTTRNQTKVITCHFLTQTFHDNALHGSTVECPSPTGCKGL